MKTLRNPLFLTFFILLTISLLSLLFIMIVMKTKQEKSTQKPNLPLRKPAVAGSFYPGSQKELAATISALLNQAEVFPATQSAKIIIVPHAGISYSGRIAAWGFKQIEGRDYHQIILLGSSHRSFFNQAAVFDKGIWETPLGRVEIDEGLAKKIVDKGKKIVADTSPHAEEHSLEIELIFLQKVLKNFKIVPILLSQTSDELIESLAQKISQNLDEQTLLVASTDLSHYPPYETATKVDGETIKAILSGKKDVFAKTVANLENQGYPGVGTCACGAEAVKVALRVGEILNLEFKKIKYENSGDVGGDQSQVVGYVAIVGYGKNASATYKLDGSAQKEALEIARRTLEEHFEGRRTPEIIPKNKGLLEQLGAFVTIRNKGELRGCIGEFEPKETLYKVIQKMTLAAATEDIRFMPIQAKELKDIKIEISIMTPKRKINDWQEIQLGKHGVVVQKGMRAGTFLPQVATETGWGPEEFLSHLCAEKAGLAQDCYKDPSTNLFVFEAQIVEEK